MRIFATTIMMGLSLFPLLLLGFCLVYPVVVVCRLYQILKLFIFNVAGQCVRKLFCCCCY